MGFKPCFLGGGLPNTYMLLVSSEVWHSSAVVFSAVTRPNQIKIKQFSSTIENAISQGAHPQFGSPGLILALDVPLAIMKLVHG